MRSYMASSGNQLAQGCGLSTGWTGDLGVFPSLPERHFVTRRESLEAGPRGRAVGSAIVGPCLLVDKWGALESREERRLAVVRRTVCRGTGDREIGRRLLSNAGERWWRWRWWWQWHWRWREGHTSKLHGIVRWIEFNSLGVWLQKLPLP